MQANDTAETKFKKEKMARSVVLLLVWSFSFYESAGGLKGDSEEDQKRLSGKIEPRDEASWSASTVSSCVDLRDECPDWADGGHCTAQPDYMYTHCPYSCEICHRAHLKNPQSTLFEVSSLGELQEQSQSPYVVQAVGANFLGVPQYLDVPGYEQAIYSKVKSAEMYLEAILESSTSSSQLKDLCTLKHPNCAYWSIAGECTNNPIYMNLNCPAVCETCHILDPCPVDRNAKNAWYPGDVTRMFENIVERASRNDSLLVASVLSRPRINSNGTDEGGPWLITLDGFLSAAEADRLVELGTHTVGFTRSTTGKNRDFVSDQRTSETAWCNVPHCEEDPVVEELFERMYNWTGIAAVNSENLQLLRYQTGQYYVKHHDYIPGHIDSVHGSRILTLFLYLNGSDGPPTSDNAAKHDTELRGGGTHFTELGLTVQPRKGRAVLWPNVVDSDPHLIDERTNHEALPVEKGIKYGANAWFHQREFVPECA